MKIDIFEAERRGREPYEFGLQGSQPRLFPLGKQNFAHFSFRIVSHPALVIEYHRLASRLVKCLPQRGWFGRKPAIFTPCVRAIRDAFERQDAIFDLSPYLPVLCVGNRCPRRAATRRLCQGCASIGVPARTA